MTRTRRWIAVAFLLLVGSFAVGAAVPRGDAEPQGPAARPLGEPAGSARIDALSTPPRLPGLRRPAREVKPSVQRPALPQPSSQPDSNTAPPPPPPPTAVLPPDAPPE